MEPQVPVITIDGPTASGKGTVAREVAVALQFNYLDSGAFYRAAAWLALRRGVSADNVEGLEGLVAAMRCHFEEGAIYCEGEDVSAAIRQEEVGLAASQIAQWGEVRHRLNERFHGFARLPGLVAEGRDMGTVVFPGADLKVFLTAGVDVRAQRRAQQLGLDPIRDAARIRGLCADLEARDARDRGRGNAPLVTAHGAHVLDSSAMTAAAVVVQVLEWWRGSAQVSA